MQWKSGGAVWRQAVKDDAVKFSHIKQNQDIWGYFYEKALLCNFDKK